MESILKVTAAVPSTPAASMAFGETTLKKRNREKEKGKEKRKRKKNKGNLVEEKKPERYRKLFAKRAVFPESLREVSSGYFQRP